MNLEQMRRQLQSRIDKRSNALRRAECYIGKHKHHCGTLLGHYEFEYALERLETLVNNQKLDRKLMKVLLETIRKFNLEQIYRKHVDEEWAKISRRKQ